ncbi:hypothetical protein [Paenibacillus sp. y28]|uniref:hypothetical protein n=1 Tax=Paenibacillus sp. y28 TaxID=3129110 RepID=UPI003016AC8B
MSQLSLPWFLQKIQEMRQTYPWYSGLLPEGGVQSFEELPLITSEVLERYYYSSEMDPGLTVYRTSGTSGRSRKAIAYSDEDEEVYQRHKVTLFSRLLAGSPVKRAASDMGTGHAASTAEPIFQAMGLETLSIPFQLPVEEHIRLLGDFRPDLLYTMPSLLDSILAQAQDIRSFGIRKVILVGETAPRQWQRNVAGVLGIEPSSVIDTYGCIELGTMAYYDHEIGRYRVMDGLIAEGITPLEAGLEEVELGEKETLLVLTSFVRRYFPALRYVTYDVVRDLRTEELDGVMVQTFEAIVKRVGPELKHGEKISIYDIEEVVYRYVRQASVRVLVNDNRLSVFIHSSAEALSQEVLDYIREGIQNQIAEIGQMIASGMLDEIRVAAVADGEQLASGKVKNKRLYYSE